MTQQPTQDELLPCPFCGGKPELNITAVDSVIVICRKCFNHIQHKDYNGLPESPGTLFGMDKEQATREAIAAWNRRQHAGQEQSEAGSCRHDFKPAGWHGGRGDEPYLVVCPDCKAQEWRSKPEQQDAEVDEALGVEIGRLIEQYLVTDIIKTDKAVMGVYGLGKQIATTFHSLRTPSPLPIRGEGWRPISTAPRDGTHILVWWPDEMHCPVTAHYSTGKWSDGIGWKFTGWGAEKMTAPTHWMHLPSSPDAADAAAENRRAAESEL